MYFNTKSYLKSTRNHTAKHALNISSPERIKLAQRIFTLISFLLPNVPLRDEPRNFGLHPRSRKVTTI
jgi:hypothetical protein